MSTSAARTPPMPPAFFVVPGGSVRHCLEVAGSEVFAVIEHAYTAHKQGKTVLTGSHFLTFPDKPSARIIALPAHIQNDVGAPMTGIKWISSFPENLERQLPRASAVLILNDGVTGYPVACMEGSIISAARTAASAVLGAYHLNGKQRTAKGLAVIGTGLIARFVVDYFLKAGWQLGALRLYDKNAGYMHEFARRFAPDFPGAVKLCDTAEQAIESSDIVLFATTAGAPHIHETDVFAGNPLVLHLSLRDLSAEIVARASNVVDDIEASFKANTSLHLAEQAFGRRDFVSTTLPDILLGAAVPQRNRPVIFSPFGIGILDIALGSFVLRWCVENRMATEIPNFFAELSRF